MYSYLVCNLKCICLISEKCKSVIKFDIFLEFYMKSHIIKLGFKNIYVLF